MGWFGGPPVDDALELGLGTGLAAVLGALGLDGLVQFPNSCWLLSNIGCALGWTGTGAWVDVEEPVEGLGFGVGVGFGATGMLGGAVIAFAEGGAEATAGPSGVAGF